MIRIGGRMEGRKYEREKNRVKGVRKGVAIMSNQKH